MLQSTSEIDFSFKNKNETETKWLNPSAWRYNEYIVLSIPCHDKNDDFIDLSYAFDWYCDSKEQPFLCVELEYKGERICIKK